jgi:hypothetical protein
MNEATLEARIAAILLRIFPSVGPSSIEHQLTFKVRLGHQEHLIDGKREFARGRLDILLKINSQPTVLVEVKAPDAHLAPADVDQGISYARLHDPIVPIVVVTNGGQTWIYHTYNRKRWNGNSLDLDTVKKIVESTLTLAAKEVDAAVCNLLGGSPAIWGAALVKATNAKLRELNGLPEDFSRPLSKEFSVPRNATQRISNLVRNGARAIALIGSPLSGKTSVLAQLANAAEDGGYIPFYVECDNESVDVVKLIAAALAEEFFQVMPAHETEEWLRRVLRAHEGKRLVLLVDGVSRRDQSLLIRQVEDLLSSSAQRLSVILAVTESDFEHLQRVQGRPTFTALGRRLRPIFLDEFDDDEFELAKEILYKNLRLVIEPGGDDNFEMRQPRLLRLHIAAYCKEGNESRDDLLATIPSITTISFLDEIWETFAGDADLRVDLLRFAEARISSHSQPSGIPHIAFLRMSSGAVDWDSAEAVMGEERINRLVHLGYLKRVSLPEDIVLIPTVPELAAAAAAHYVAKTALKHHRSGNPSEAHKFVLTATEGIPLGELAGARAAIEIGKTDGVALGYHVQALMSDPPKATEFSEGSNYLMYADSDREINAVYKDGKLIVQFDGGAEHSLEIDDLGREALISNMHPWLVLSHLAAIPMAADDEIIAPKILYRVGQFSGTLRAGRVFGKASSTWEHDLPGVGKFPCPKRGIVEPITFAMKECFLFIPHEMARLCRAVVQQRSLLLGFRLLTAARYYTNALKTPRVKFINKIASWLEKGLDPLLVQACAGEKDSPVRSS